MTRSIVESNLNDREIVVASLRWHTARLNRALLSAQKREIEKNWGIGAWVLQNDKGREITRAKLVEQNALRALAKVCKAHRGHLGMVEDAELVIEGRFIEIEMNESPAQ